MLMKARISPTRALPVVHDAAPETRSGTPKVAVLLTTKVGERFLAQQLDSIESQTYSRWEVWASDDGSDDDTPLILDRYRSRWAGRWPLSVQRGPRRGFAANFLSLVTREEMRADYYAYCDQDDVWEPWKIERALRWLDDVPRDMPALYCSRTRLIDAHGRHIGFSPLFKREPEFSNALVQNVGGGNTMVFNDAARTLLLKAGNEMEIVSHDWWTYLAVTGCGGHVRYDSAPGVRYRQHDANLVGSNAGWSARARRMRMLLHGRYQSWHTRNIEALAHLRPFLTPESQRLLDQFSVLRGQPMPNRLNSMRRCGLYRQTGWGTLGLYAAAILNKL